MMTKFDSEAAQRRELCSVLLAQALRDIPDLVVVSVLYPRRARNTVEAELAPLLEQAASFLEPRLLLRSPARLGV